MWITYLCRPDRIIESVLIDLDFELLTVDSEVFQGSRLLGRPTILVLLRYLGWLYCQEHLSQLREFDQEIATRHGRIAVVSFASPVHLKAFADRLGHPFLWLADPQRISYERLGPRRHGLAAIAPPRVIWGYVRLILRGRIWRPEQLDLAQMGGDFVFDREGNLTLSYVSASSDDRPSVGSVMAAFRRAASATTGAAER